MVTDTPAPAASMVRPRGAAMELHTRNAKDNVALAQVGAAAIILWHNSGCSVPSRATNSLASDQENGPDRWEGVGGSDRDRGLFGGSRSPRLRDPGANKPCSRLGERKVTIPDAVRCWPVVGSSLRTGPKQGRWPGIQPARTGCETDRKGRYAAVERPSRRGRLAATISYR